MVAVTRAGVEIDGRVPGRPWRTVRALIPADRVQVRPTGGLATALSAPLAD